MLPSPRTWTVGELLTASKLNTDLRDGLNFLLAPPLAMLVKSGTQSIPNNTATAVTWETEQIDRDGGHSTSSQTSRYVCQTTGWYQIVGTVRWTNLVTGGELRAAQFRKNGSSYLPGSSNATKSGATSVYTVQVVTTLVQLVVSDYVELIVQQDSGGAMNVLDTWNSGPDTNMCVRWVSA